MAENRGMRRPPPEALKKMFRVMALVKAIDEALRKGIGTGKFFCVYYPPRGQEGIAGAIGAILRADDRLVTTYRALHDHIAKGVPIRDIVAEMLGKKTGSCGGKGGPMHIVHPESGTMLSTGIVGAGLPIANGIALSAKLQGTDRVTLATFGDGASNTGAFHESLNLAKVWELPLVLVCQNNQYAEMTPFRHTQRNERISDRAAAYGMPGAHVDGNDPVAVYEALDEAVARARKGGGPTLVECKTYRFWGHYFGDTMGYMPKEELEAARADDPYPKFRASLVESKEVPESELATIEAEAVEAARDAIDFALESPPTGPEDLITDVYRDPSIAKALSETSG